MQIQQNLVSFELWQARSQVLRFGGAKYIFGRKTFVFIICLK